MSVGGKGGSTTTTTQLDPRFQNFRNFVFNQARGQAGQGFQPFGGDRVAGVDPRTTEGFNQLGTADPNVLGGLASQLGGLGASQDFLQNALGFQLPQFNQENLAAFQNPFEQQVVGGVQSDFDRLRSQAANQTGDQAIAQGAFGGSREGVARGQRLGDLDRSEASTLGNIRSQGFNQAAQNFFNQNQQGLNQFGQQLGAAGQLGQFGFGAAGLLDQIRQQTGGAQVAQGELNRGINQAGLDTNFQEFMREQNFGPQQLQLLQGILGSSPFGQTQTTQQQGGFNPLSAALGIGGFALGGPFGGLLGGAAGNLLGSQTGGGTPQSLPTGGGFPGVRFGFG